MEPATFVPQFADGRLSADHLVLSDEFSVPTQLLSCLTASGSTKVALSPLKSAAKRSSGGALSTVLSRGHSRELSDMAFLQRRRHHRIALQLCSGQAVYDTVFPSSANTSSISVAPTQEKLRREIHRSDSHQRYAMENEASIRWHLANRERLLDEHHSLMADRRALEFASGSRRDPSKSRGAVTVATTYDAEAMEYSAAGLPS